MFWAAMQVTRHVKYSVLCIFQLCRSINDYHEEQHSQYRLRETVVQQCMGENNHLRHKSIRSSAIFRWSCIAWHRGVACASHASDMHWHMYVPNIIVEHGLWRHISASLFLAARLTTLHLPLNFTHKNMRSPWFISLCALSQNSFHDVRFQLYHRPEYYQKISHIQQLVLSDWFPSATKEQIACRGTWYHFPSTN